MSIRKIRPGPGQPTTIVRKGKSLDTSTCPACNGTAVPAVNAKGVKILQCQRCGAQISSTPF